MIPIYQPFINSETLQYAKDALDSTWVSSSGKYLDLGNLCEKPHGFNRGMNRTII
jgi:hypothetical protein